jgi:uncharacterized membrane protein YvbJ
VIEMYCKNCGSELHEGNFCQECGTATGDIHKKATYTENYDPLQLDPKYLKWVGSIILSLGIFGVLNFLFAPLAGVILIIFGVLIYITKSINVIIGFAMVWLLLVLYQFYTALYFNPGYLFFVLINGTYVGYLLYKVNHFKNEAKNVNAI